MATTLNIVYGSTTISLTSDGVKLLDYSPGVTEDDNGIIQDRVIIELTSTGTNNKAKIESIRKAFLASEQYFDKTQGDRVYLKFQLDGLSTLYRGLITRPSPGKKAGYMPLNLGSGGIQWTRSAMRMPIVLFREEFYENSETEIALSNTTEEDATGGIQVSNFYSGLLFGAATVSFTASTRTIADSGNGFGVFRVGDVISVRGSGASPTNDGIYTVATVDGGGANITVNEPLGADEGAGSTINIYDFEDYIDFDAADIDGDEPALCRLDIENDYATPNLETIWMTYGYKNSPKAFPHILEIGDSDTGSDSADGTCSSSIKRSYTINASSSGEAKVTGWTLPASMLKSADGGWFRVFARFASSTNITAVKLRFKLLYGSSVIWEGEQFNYDSTYDPIAHVIFEMDSIKLPPSTPQYSDPTALTLQLWGVSLTDATKSITLDCFKLLPVDGFRVLRSKAGIADNSHVIDDGETGTYFQQISSLQVNDIAQDGPQFMLDPKQNGRIYFVFHSTTANTAEIDRDVLVSLYVRPRISLI